MSERAWLANVFVIIEQIELVRSQIFTNIHKYNIECNSLITIYFSI